MQSYASILDAADADIIAGFEKAMGDEGLIERKDDDGDDDDDDEVHDDLDSDNKFAALGLVEKFKGRSHSTADGKVVGTIHDMSNGKSLNVGS